MTPPEIKSDQETEQQIAVDDGCSQHFEGDKVSISLRYYDTSCECFSEWNAKELKAFTKLIEKLFERTVAQVTSNTNLCHAHMGKPKLARFSRPESLSPDLTFYGLDVNGKARIHGFFARSTFFLVWLDRKHDCFGK